LAQTPLSSLASSSLLFLVLMLFFEFQAQTLAFNPAAFNTPLPVPTPLPTPVSGVPVMPSPPPSKKQPAIQILLKVLSSPLPFLLLSLSLYLPHSNLSLICNFQGPTRSLRALPPPLPGSTAAATHHPATTTTNSTDATANPTTAATLKPTTATLTTVKPESRAAVEIYYLRRISRESCNFGRY
jgi:hypothetical protein